MRKKIAIISALMVLLLLCACGGSKPEWYQAEGYVLDTFIENGNSVAVYGYFEGDTLSYYYDGTEPVLMGTAVMPNDFNDLDYAKDNRWLDDDDLDGFSELHVRDLINGEEVIKVFTFNNGTFTYDAEKTKNYKPIVFEPAPNEASAENPLAYLFGSKEGYDVHCTFSADVEYSISDDGKCVNLSTNKEYNPTDIDLSKFVGSWKQPDHWFEFTIHDDGTWDYVDAFDELQTGNTYRIIGIGLALFDKDDYMGRIIKLNDDGTLGDFSSSVYSRK